MGNDITGKFYLSTKSNMLSEDRFNGFAGMIYSDICRRERKWYQHPKWHIHHWVIKFDVFRNFKRRYFDRCSICRNRLKGSAAYTDWNSTKVWCHECEKTTVKQNVDSNLRATV